MQFRLVARHRSEDKDLSASEGGISAATSARLRAFRRFFQKLTDTLREQHRFTMPPTPDPSTGARSERRAGLQV